MFSLVSVREVEFTVPVRRRRRRRRNRCMIDECAAINIGLVWSWRGKKRDGFNTSRVHHCLIRSSFLQQVRFFFPPSSFFFSPGRIPTTTTTTRKELINQRIVRAERSLIKFRRCRIFNYNLKRRFFIRSSVLKNFPGRNFNEVLLYIVLISS